MSVIPLRIRVLAIVTAVFAVSWVIGLVIPMVGLLLALGALIQPKARTSGRWLMWVSAFLLNYVLPYGVRFAVDFPKRKNVSLIILLLLISTILVVICDIALVWEAWTSGKSAWTRSSFDWIAWLGAVLLSAWLVPNAWRAIQQYVVAGAIPRTADFLLVGLSNAAVLCFDGALIALAIRTRSDL